MTKFRDIYDTVFADMLRSSNNIKVTTIRTTLNSILEEAAKSAYGDASGKIGK
jgi:hypothetical protein